MTEHHTDPIEENLETHPVKLGIMIAGGAVGVIVAIYLLTQFAIGAWGGRSLKDDPAMAPHAVSERLAPVAKLALDSKAPAAPAPTAAAPAITAAVPAAPAKAAAAAAGSGKATYDTACAVCHGAGVAGAPKLGDKAAWAPRVGAGKDALYASALKGKGAMPPKGGNLALSDADVKAAVDHLVAAAK